MTEREHRGRVAVGEDEVETATHEASDPFASLAVAHGAGANMDHPFMVGFTRRMAELEVTTVRFNFLYTQKGRKAPDPEPRLRAAWLAVFADLRERFPALPAFAGGKSLGGRIASMCVADGMPAAGVVFLGYPLHPPGKTDRVRDEHLYRIDVPMLFIQGTADPFAQPSVLRPVLERLGARASYAPIEDGDHSFNVRGARRPPSDVGAGLAELAAPWMRTIVEDV